MPEIHLVSHTHWDREWYHPAGRFRQRLVALVDELLDAPPRMGESFLLDGQGIVLEDYLAVRPERGADLAALLRAGRLEAGPWYVLADELIPSGEALVRNLLAGRRVLRALSADSPPVLYCPDSFGHPAALPAIAAGFGLPLVMLWRGYGGARWPAGDSARWCAPDGSCVELWHFPPDGYETGSNLPSEAAPAASRWAVLRDALLARATRGVTLLPNGADHHARQRRLDEAIAALASAMNGEATLVRSSLRGFADALMARRVDLPEVRGELRDSYGYTWTLQGTFATRAAQKRANAHAERLLVREAEPWSALARLYGGPSRRALVHAAWKSLLACHPHDTLCGCAVDAVARAMDERLGDTATQGRGIVEDAMLDLAAHDRATARVARERWTPALLVRNPAARPRGGVAIVEWKDFLADVPVGPASAGAVPLAPPAGAPSPAIARAGQVVSERVSVELTESPRHYPDADWVRTTRVALWMTEVPAYGQVAIDPGVAMPLPPEVAPARAEGHAIDNGVLRLELSADGVVSLHDARTGAHLPSLVSLEDRRDHGDLYTPSIRGAGRRVSFVGASVLRAGPLDACIEGRWVIATPGGELPVRLRFSLQAGRGHLVLEACGENLGADHRLRLLVHTGVASIEHWADAAFGPVRRAPLVLPPADREREVPPPTHPLHRWVSRVPVAGAATHGATLFSDGLAEYEAMDDGTIAVTLVRAVGELSRGNLPERPGHAGWPAPTPGAQSGGAFEGRFGLLLHESSRTAAVIDAIEQTADDVLLPLGGTTLRSAIATVPARAGVALHGAGLAMSALKESEDGASLVLRCVNLLEREVQGAWELGVMPGAASYARLDETPLESLAVQGNTVPFVAPPRAIVTILVPFPAPHES